MSCLKDQFGSFFFKGVRRQNEKQISRCVDWTVVQVSKNTWVTPLFGERDSHRWVLARYKDKVVFPTPFQFVNTQILAKVVACEVSSMFPPKEKLQDQTEDGLGRCSWKGPLRQGTKISYIGPGHLISNANSPPCVTGSSPSPR